MIKARLRQARDAATSLGVPRKLAQIPGPELLILTYHRVLPRSHGEWDTEQPGMLVTPETLAMHCETLARHFEWVHLEEWIGAREAGRPLPRLACAMTFDDGWRDNYDHALPVLERYGVPATIFLVSDLVGTHYAFWPNRLARLLKGLPDAAGTGEWPNELVALLRGAGFPASGQVTTSQVDRAIEACKALPDATLHALLDRIGRPSGSSSRSRDLMDWDEIRALQDSGLVRFGSHTRRHTRLVGTLSGETVDDEVKGSRDRLTVGLGRSPVLFCYPNGDSCPASRQAVRQSYRAAVTTETGWNDPGTGLHSLRRVGVHEDVTSTRAGLLRRTWRARQAT